jgi:hypothetical protein
MLWFLRVLECVGVVKCPESSTCRAGIWQVQSAMCLVAVLDLNRPGTAGELLVHTVTQLRRGHLHACMRTRSLKHLGSCFCLCGL